MSVYMILNSNKSLEYCPDNKPYHFKTYLKFPLTFNGTWKVALTEAKIIDTISSFEFHKDVYIYSTICEETIVDGEKRSLLRRLFKKDGNYTNIFQTFSYVPVKENEINHFDIYLKDEGEHFTSFIKEPTSFTLHFRKYPFLV